MDNQKQEGEKIVKETKRRNEKEWRGRKDQWRMEEKEGRKEGWKEGRKEGRVEGRKEGRKDGRTDGRRNCAK